MDESANVCGGAVGYQKGERVRDTQPLVYDTFTTNDDEFINISYPAASETQVMGHENLLTATPLTEPASTDRDTSHTVENDTPIADGDGEGQYQQMATADSSSASVADIGGSGGAGAGAGAGADPVDGNPHEEGDDSPILELNAQGCMGDELQDLDSPAVSIDYKTEDLPNQDHTLHETKENPLSTNAPPTSQPIHMTRDVAEADLDISENTDANPCMTSESELHQNPASPVEVTRFEKGPDETPGKCHLNTSTDADDNTLSPETAMGLFKEVHEDSPGTVPDEDFDNALPPSNEPIEPQWSGQFAAEKPVEHHSADLEDPIENNDNRTSDETCKTPELGDIDLTPIEEKVDSLTNLHAGTMVKECDDDIPDQTGDTDDLPQLSETNFAQDIREIVDVDLGVMSQTLESGEEIKEAMLGAGVNDVPAETSKYCFDGQESREDVRDDIEAPEISDANTTPGPLESTDDSIARITDIVENNEISDTKHDNSDDHNPCENEMDDENSAGSLNVMSGPCESTTTECKASVTAEDDSNKFSFTNENDLNYPTADAISKKDILENSDVNLHAMPDPLEPHTTNEDKTSKFHESEIDDVIEQEQGTNEEHAPHVEAAHDTETDVDLISSISHEPLEIGTEPPRDIIGSGPISDGPLRVSTACGSESMDLIETAMVGSGVPQYECKADITSDGDNNGFPFINKDNSNDPIADAISNKDIRENTEVNLHVSLDPLEPQTTDEDKTSQVHEGEIEVLIERVQRTWEQAPQEEIAHETETDVVTSINHEPLEIGTEPPRDSIGSGLNPDDVLHTSTTCASESASFVEAAMVGSEALAELQGTGVVRSRTAHLSTEGAGETGMAAAAEEVECVPGETRGVADGTEVHVPPELYLFGVVIIVAAIIRYLFRTMTG